MWISLCFKHVVSKEYERASDISSYLVGDVEYSFMLYLTYTYMYSCVLVPSGGVERQRH